MKRALLKVLIVYLLCSVNVSARENNFEITITIDETNILTTAQNAPVKVKIANKAAPALNTETLPGILFKFSKCRRSEACALPKDVFVGGSDIKPKILKKDDAMEFAVNLSELSWNDANAPVLDFSQIGTFALVPEGAYFFYAEIRIFDKTVKSNRTPRYKRIVSNEIEVKLQRAPVV